MKKFLMMILCVVSLACFAVGCDGTGDGETYVQNKAEVVSQFNTSIDDLKTVEFIKKDDFNVAKDFKAEFAEQATKNKKIDLNFLFGEEDLANAGTYLDSTSGSASIYLAGNEINFDGVIDGKKQNVVIYSDDNGLYFVTVEGAGVASCNYYLPFDLTTTLFDAVGFTGDKLDTAFISKLLFDNEQTIASCLGAIPALTEADVSYNEVTGVHTISNAYVKRAVDAVIDYMEVGDGASSLKVGIAGLIDNLGLEITYTVTDQGAVSSKIKINPNKVFFDVVYDYVYGASDLAEADRPITACKVELAFSPDKTSVSFQIAGAKDLYISGAISSVAKSGTDSLSVELEVKLPISEDSEGNTTYGTQAQGDVSTVEASVKLNFATDYSNEVSFDVDLFLKAPNDFIIDLDGEFEKTKKEVNFDLNLTQINIPNGDMGYGLAKDLKLSGGVEFSADLTNGDFTGSLDLDVRDKVSVDFQKGVYVYNNLDCIGTLSGNLRNLMKDAGLIPIDLSITSTSTYRAENPTTGVQVELPDDYANQVQTITLKAVNVQDGTCEIDGEDKIVETSTTTERSVADLTLVETDVTEYASPASDTLKARFTADKDELIGFDIEDYWDEKFLIDTYIEDYFGYQFNEGDSGVFYLDLGDGVYLKADFEYDEDGDCTKYSLVYADSLSDITNLQWVVVPLI